MTHLVHARGRLHRPVLQNRKVVRMAAVAAALTLIVSAGLPGRAQEQAKEAKKNQPSTPAYLTNGSIELGGHMITKSGSVLRLAKERDEDLQAVANVGPFLAATIDTENRAAFLLTSEGELKHHSYPDFQHLGAHRLGAVGYHAAIDAKAGKLYIAAFERMRRTAVFGRTAKALIGRARDDLLQQPLTP